MKSDKVYDIRVVERYIQRGTITKDEYIKHLGALEDCNENAMSFDVKLENETTEEEE